MAREGRRPRRDRAAAGLRQAPSRQLRNPYPPFEILSADQIEAIHHASLEVLAEVGMNFLLDEARAILKEAGCAVEAAGTRVRFDPAFVEERIRTAPAAFTLHARNPARSVRIGENVINFCMVASTPNVSDLERGRITGNFEDFCNLTKLAHSLNICHMIAGYPVEPVDLRPRPATSMRSPPWRRSATARSTATRSARSGSATRSRSPGSRARRATSSCCASPR